VSEGCETIAKDDMVAYDHWRCNLWGRLKAVKEQLDTPRRLQAITRRDGGLMWWWGETYRHGEHIALGLLPQYNKGDVVNLKAPGKKLGEELGGRYPK
jgi:hypothetical protein